MNKDTNFYSTNNDVENDARYAEEANAHGFGDYHAAAKLITLDAEDRASIKSALLLHIKAHPITPNHAMHASQGSPLTSPVARDGSPNPYNGAGHGGTHAQTSAFSVFFNFNSKHFTLAAVGLLFVTGTVTAFAAQRALPGDLLYPIKIHIVENANAIAMLTPETSAAWSIDRLEHRIQEARDISSDSSLSQGDKQSRKAADEQAFIAEAYDAREQIAMADDGSQSPMDSQNGQRFNLALTDAVNVFTHTGTVAADESVQHAATPQEGDKVSDTGTSIALTAAPIKPKKEVAAVPTVPTIASDLDLQIENLNTSLRIPQYIDSTQFSNSGEASIYAAYGGHLPAGSQPSTYVPGQPQPTAQPLPSAEPQTLPSNMEPLPSVANQQQEQAAPSASATSSGRSSNQPNGSPAATTAQAVYSTQ